MPLARRAELSTSYDGHAMGTTDVISHFRIVREPHEDIESKAKLRQEERRRKKWHHPMSVWPQRKRRVELCTSRVYGCS